MSGARRLVYLSFDGPDLSLLQRGIDEGWLPTLGGLVREGRFVPLDDVQDLMTAPMWPTLVTGTHVSDHLLVSDVQLVPGTYRLAPVPAAASRRPPFWRHLSDAGLHSTIASVYAAPLLERFLGTQVIGWGTHDPFTTKGQGPRADPPAVLRSLRHAVGRRDIRYGTRIPRTPAEFRRYVDRALAGIAQQGRALRLLLERTRWDFFFGGFSEAHEAGHLMWHFATADHPQHDPSAAAELRGGLAAIYRAIDAAVGALAAALPREVPLCLVSPYGMGHHHHLNEVVRPLLERAGLMGRGGAGVVADDRRLRTLALARRAAQRVVPAWLRPALGHLVPRDRWLGAMALADVDWSVTRAFPLPADGSSFLRLNLAGREPAGIVRPGLEYADVCARITGLLESLTDPVTGERLAARVARVDALLGVAPAGPLPDLCVQWVRRHRVQAVYSPEVGVVSVPSTDPRTALHWAPGFILGRGPGIAPSGSTRLEGPSARVVDVAATALARLGAPRPPDLPGRPIAALTGPVA